MSREAVRFVGLAVSLDSEEYASMLLKLQHATCNINSNVNRKAFKGRSLADTGKPLLCPPLHAWALVAKPSLSEERQVWLGSDQGDLQLLTCKLGL